ncbi:hypothetical protein PMIN01_08793 [Paraphaeosphaeria minitans]|uniref:Uncharacterized protein n=1 Tax=Paraphaeosphaeria minitans TaxID=565426 RepID=A0A9P6GDN8_9PLEO|nr:hypothetical protein PMIN01_08793 [Paraphaeosphaeria minitans]
MNWPGQVPLANGNVQASWNTGRISREARRRAGWVQLQRGGVSRAVQLTADSDAGLKAARHRKRSRRVRRAGGKSSESGFCRRL